MAKDLAEVKLKEIGDGVERSLRDIIRSDGQASVRALGGDAKACISSATYGVLYEDPRVADLVYSLAYSSIERGYDVDDITHKVMDFIREKASKVDAPVTLNTIASALYHSEPDLRTALDIVNFRIDLQSRASTMTEGSAKCRRCGSTDTNYIVRQVRCADEPPTTFLMCNTCGRGSNPIGEH